MAIYFEKKSTEGSSVLSIYGTAGDFGSLANSLGKGLSVKGFKTQPDMKLEILHPELKSTTFCAVEFVVVSENEISALAESRIWRKVLVWVAWLGFMMLVALVLTRKW